MKIITIALIYLALSVAAAAQTQTEKPKENLQIPAMQPESKRAEMKKLDALIGSWVGSGWIMHASGKESFVGTETVQKKIDGLALLVEGNYKNKDGVIIHETLAVLSPNAKTKNFGFQTFLANGMSGEHEFKVTETGWRWGLQFPGGTMRYDIRIENDTWIETGEMSRDDGKTWMKFFEMNLKKIK